MQYPRSYLLLIAIFACGLLGGCNLPIQPIEPSQEVQVAAIAANVAPIATILPTAMAPTISVSTTVVIAPANPTPTPIPQTPTPTTSPSPTPIPCTTSGRTIAATYASRVEGPTRSYRIYLPPCYEASTDSYPTIYMLHGNLYGEEEWDNIGIDDEADVLTFAKEISPVIIVMPEGRSVSNTTSGGDFSYEAILVDELIPHVDAVYRTNRLRAIGGLSRGGYWAAEVAFRHPDLFISVGLHAPVFLDTGDDREINPLWTVESADITALCIAIDFGSADVYIYTAQPVRNALLGRNIPHHWTIYPDGRHAYPYWTTHRADYLRWYMAQFDKGSC